jgi:hypothetical protein
VTPHTWKQRQVTLTTEVTRETERDGGCSRALSRHLQKSVGILSQLCYSPFLLNPFQFTHIPLLPSSSKLDLTEIFFITTLQGPQPLHCWEGVFTASLHSNGSYSIVACVFIAAGMCLPSRCLAVNVYSDFQASCHNIVHAESAVK